jgi:FHA domain/Cyclic nucleotide-binding domain
MNHITQIARRAAPQISLSTTLQDLLQEIDPLTKAASLHALNQTSPELIKQLAGNLDGTSDALIQEPIDRVLQRPLAATAVPTLTIDLELHGHHEQRVYRQPVVKIGRASDNDVVILDDRVSRYHAVFKIDANGITIRDLRSQSGVRFGKTDLRDAESIVANDTKIYLSPIDDIEITPRLSMTASQEQPITTLEKLLWLRSSPLFQSLNYQNLLAIAHNSSLIIYNQGDVLCQAGEPAVSLLLPIAGTAQSDRHTFASGETIGEVGILSKTTYAETVVAKSPKVPALVIEADRFNELLDREPKITRELLVSIGQRLK